MPFIRMDVATYDEIMSEFDPEDLPPGMEESRPSGEFEYEPASARFAPEELGPVARVMLDVLIHAGVTDFRVRYDGGFDEGFAYPDALLFGEEARTVVELLREAATPELHARLRHAASLESAPYNATELYSGASPTQAATYALDELAGALATKLLGNGFGTGEYGLYGAFTANLQTGDLVDDPNAEKPAEME